ncbi:phosphoserine phosphatase SerB [Enterovibrio norvegicus]|uniref:Phosphoserine phosphatase n=2 Tax=Enterovibrio norvegicus TaxID=188144 RepID=A0A1I5TD06_9GAMM|nr:phosphoserine phosphatase [Enterovibrio norvegicus]MCC4801024.1 phosphoserine phosphatase [Enterovibrio norvegicus]OEE61166.1 phosphoserine phosphatase SerB [Enterovibrio norvegicus]OEF53983.1 phosphoserine phosphatase SerB [Enterovibrio norvegicus]OEF54879.1 phosphoserine phosphatase SerB [Enterovibrio norvegicus]PMH62507.1 phosphoserine phosphatase SerB [Enterovibrio norvegicus]
MDATSVFAIKKHTKLLTRFPSIRHFRPSDCRQAGWMLYGFHISPSYLDDFAFLTGEAVKPLAGWTVGPYEVLLMRGELTPEMMALADALSLDCALLDNIPNLFEPGLALFDMDSTAIQIECIDEIAKLAGVGEQVAAVTERAMQGELDFEQSLRERVGTLKGTDVSVLEQVRDSLPLMPGMRQLTASLQARGWKVAIASGGFTWFSDSLRDQLSLAHAESNQLVIENGKLTGEVTGQVVDAQRKADILDDLTYRYELTPTNTIAVGDGANDLKMMSAAGLGIAYHAKPKVQKEAQVAIRHADLGGVLCVLSASLLPQRLSWKG